MIWVAGRSPTLVSHTLRGVAMNLKATTLTYLAIVLNSATKVYKFAPGRMLKIFCYKLRIRLPNDNALYC